MIAEILFCFDLGITVGALIYIILAIGWSGRLDRMVEAVARYLIK